MAKFSIAYLIGDHADDDRGDERLKVANSPDIERQACSLPSPLSSRQIAKRKLKVGRSAMVLRLVFSRRDTQAAASFEFAQRRAATRERRFVAAIS